MRMIIRTHYIMWQYKKTRFWQEWNCHNTFTRHSAFFWCSSWFMGGIWSYSFNKPRIL